MQDLEEHTAMVDRLVQEAQAELGGLSCDESARLRHGYEDIGIKCVTEQWHAPERMQTSSLNRLSAAIVKDAANKPLYWASFADRDREATLAYQEMFQLLQTGAKIRSTTKSSPRGCTK